METGSEFPRPSVTRNYIFRASSVLGRYALLVSGLTCAFSVNWLMAQPPQAAQSAVGTPVPTETDIDYERDILPLWKRYCWDCHTPPTTASSLQINSRESLLRGGDYGEPALVPGQPSESLLFQVISGQHDDLTMPPEDSPQLSTSETELIRRWIAAGGLMPNAEVNPAQNHWAWQPLATSSPTTEVSKSPKSIDTFLMAQLQEADLAYSPAASRAELIRRLYLIMWGLAPSPEEVLAFSADERPDAWPRLVEQVLASPRYGERWGAHWLDVVRFGETDGFETNRERPQAWRYRDWVIQAFNEDKPYDEFLRQQLAGDQLGAPVATGFLVAGPVDIVKSPDPVLTLNQRQDELADMINTTGTAFLGLTMGCARCHDHKFDPVTQRDYFAWQAVFAGVHHGETELPLGSENRSAIERLEARRTELRQELALFLTPPTLEEGQGSRRAAVNSHLNREDFAPQSLRFLRFEIRQTNDGSEPALDEISLFSQNERLPWLADTVQLTSSGNYRGNPRHQLPHLIDEKFGNDFSWLSDTPNTGWVQISWPTAKTVDSLEWSRDRGQQFQDRLAIDYQILGSLDGLHWEVLASSAGRPQYSRESSATPYFLPDPASSEGAIAHAKWQELRGLDQQLVELQQPPRAYAGQFQTPPAVHQLFRGDPLQPREIVPPETVQFLGSLGLAPDAAEPQRRLALANWLADGDQALTSRVIVNRIWQYHFGTGLVSTPSDFGIAGARPSHPELLDFLAAELIRENWSLKHIQRLILNSAAWQQTSLPLNPQGLTRDADARWLWRFPPRRLEAEPIRDRLLQVSGELDLTPGGPGFSAFEIELENVRHYFPKVVFGPQDFRRMVYQTRVRQEKDAVFGAFDCPDATQVVPRRNQSTTPLQALNLFNSEFVWGRAQTVAQLARETHPQNLRAQIEWIYWRCYCRQPAEDEIQMASDFIQQESLEAFVRALVNSNEFLFVQ